MTALGTSPLRTRNRRTNAQYAALDDAIMEVCAADNPLTVRGVFYRVMSAGVVAKNEKEYDVVQKRAVKLRREGRLPYDWIVDGTRWRLKSTSWDSASQALHNLALTYRRELWNNQDTYVEIWSEKDAISTIISPITDAWGVPLLVARGFSSETFLYDTATQIRAANAAGRSAVAYNLGDHDPSGVAAWEHVQKRLREFAPNADITFERIAVTEEQITSLALPTRPTKATDTRAKNFTGESVEVDAIPTRILRELVEEAITKHIDPRALELNRIVEEEERRGLEAMAQGWSS